MPAVSLNANLIADSTLVTNGSVAFTLASSPTSNSSLSASTSLDNASIVADSAFVGILNVSGNHFIANSSFTANATVAFECSTSILGGASINLGPTIALNALAVSPTKIRVLFPVGMLNDANLVNPSNYTITDEFANVLTILSVTPENPPTPTSVSLVLSAPLATTRSYTVTVSGAIQMATGGSIAPNTTSFDWVQEPNTGPITIPLNEFTGEVSGGLYGNPAGMVFFSPALNASAANSVIQVEEVDVCTYAFDSYTFPQPIDPLPLITFGQGRPPGSLLGPGSGTVLWAPFPRNMDAMFELGFSPTLTNDLVPFADDGAVTVTMRATWDPTFVALLNDSAWVLYAEQVTVPSTPPLFITANNGSPIPSGGTVILVIKLRLLGQSHVTAALSHAVALQATIVADSDFFTLPATAQLTGFSTISAKLSAHLAPSVSIVADSQVVASVT